MALDMVEVMKRLGTDCIFKIDFEKIYHYVEWDFLDFVFGQMGFRLRWIGWI